MVNQSCAAAYSRIPAAREVALGEANGVEGVAASGFRAPRGYGVVDGLRGCLGMLPLLPGQVQEAAAGDARQFGFVEVADPVGLFIRPSLAELFGRLAGGAFDSCRSSRCW
ncbi:hypothetical protein GCM10014715_72170 [Streptomyces spiralis]|uniref:Uncharacterized protein n=1 Tax=Streptomyces spiralis TaxID=66376 RepID=A0A919AGE5_9ACTN|nr:hypothetical protein [Streptomyces spiralis]GHF05661.1 hypothetical protein GCM10014715_72170 [Streptomyces spiralis]